MVRPLGARGVEIHAGDRGPGEPPTHEVLELLGAEPAHPLDLLAAHPTRRRNRLLVPAIVTAQCPRRLVDREGDGAVRAAAHVAARGALPAGREAAAGPALKNPTR